MVRLVANMLQRSSGPAEAQTGNVVLQRVTKQFADHLAVDDLSLEIVAGEFLSLLGPSGCGKTTTLRMLGGFETPTSGTIFFGDQDVTDLPPHKRDVNTVFQSYALFPHLSVADNIAFGLRRKGQSKAEARAKVTDMLDAVRWPATASCARSSPREPANLVVVRRTNVGARCKVAKADAN